MCMSPQFAPEFPLKTYDGLLHKLLKYYIYAINDEKRYHVYVLKPTTNGTLQETNMEHTYLPIDTITIIGHTIVELYDYL